MVAYGFSLFRELLLAATKSFSSAHRRDEGKSAQPYTVIIKQLQLGGRVVKPETAAAQVTWISSMSPSVWSFRCNEECPAGTYGQDCKGVCNCANGARCFNIDGSCFCEPGFSGPQCRNRMCAPGNYGMHCEHKCLCEEKHTLSCHPMKGECTCQPGWAGLFCNETCPHGFYGDGCMEPCLCVNGGVCDSATGRCHCSPGFTGVHCESPCKSGVYGKNCSLECSCENFIDCSPVDGTCFCKEGWQGPDCSVPCADGTWGPGCNATCRCTNGAKCDPADGSCKCSAGWQGALCDQPCGMGSFGPGCLKRCDCIHSSGCQATSGECHCLPGWTGPHCSDPCPEGLWGPHCNRSCSDHCPNSDTCLRKTGECVCRPGYWGAACQNNSSERVGSVMVPLPPGERESWGAIGGIVVLVLLVVMLLALLLLYRRRQKDKQNHTPTVSFSTSRTVNSEYAVPDVPHSYHHYYSNPSYHTLSQNRPPLPHLPNNHDRVVKNTNNQLFHSVKNAARERRGLFGVETNATLPADWKHHETRKGSGPSSLEITSLNSDPEPQSILGDIAPCQTMLHIRSKLVLQDTIQTFYLHNLDYQSHWDDGNVPSIQPDRRRPRCPYSGPRSGRGISAGMSLYTSSHSCRSDRETETDPPLPHLHFCWQPFPKVPAGHESSQRRPMNPGGHWQTPRTGSQSAPFSHLHSLRQFGPQCLSSQAGGHKHSGNSSRPAGDYDLMSDKHQIRFGKAVRTWRLLLS
ncbi:hypothetical protein CCH79_00015498 [Gambusia affinis]|uniref:EGF-like domain-containing protein n=1 Tax=Gambusia affinis TaxID=33528 RepID=A0A315VP48_GAMAF|nr:hypothetical protein CCH79_00015498 [Gambusia affinis]